MKRMLLISAAATLALAGLVGCGSAEDRVKIVAVAGTITKAGKPLPDARLTFTPEPDNAEMTPGSASTGPGGEYTAIWLQRKGLAPGKYRVVITPSQLAPSEIPPEFKDDPLMAELAVAARPAPRNAPKGPTLKTEFQADVADPGGTFNFDISPPAAGK